MFNKKDPLIDSVKNIMKENEIRRDAERKLNEELGIASKKALPFEHHANYDALLEQKIAEALHPNQQKLDVHEPEKDELTAQDFKMLRAKKKPMKEEDDKSVQGSGAVTKDGKDVVSSTAPKAEGPTDKERAALTNKVKEVMKEEQVDESVSATHYKDADGNKTWDVSHKKKKIGSITVNKKGSWSYEHEPSGNYEDGYESKREAVKELKDTHKYHEKIMKDGTLEEASRKTLHSYINKAIDKVKSGEEPEGKRAKGLRKATTKLYKVDEERDSDKPETTAPAKNPPTTSQSGKSEFTNPMKSHPFDSRPRLSSGDVEDFEKEASNKERYTKSGIESRKRSLELQKQADDVTKQEKEYEKERIKKGIVPDPNRYRWEETEINEKAPSGAKFERMVKHIKKKYAKDGLTKQEKSIAYATAWKAKNKEEMKEAVEAELRKNLGEKYNKIMEQDDDVEATPADRAAFRARTGSTVGAPSSNMPSDVKASPADREAFRSRTGSTVGANDGGPSDRAPSVTTKAPSMTMGPGGGLTPQGSAVSKAAPAAKPATPISASGRENVPGPNDRPSAAPRPAAPRPAAPKAAAPAPTPAAKPTAPVSGPGEDTSSPLAALRQYQASKEAGAFDKPAAAAPAARPAAPRPSAPRPAAPRISAPTGSAPGTPASRSMAPSGFKPAAPSQRMARGGMMAESLEETIKKIIKE